MANPLPHTQSKTTARYVLGRQHTEGEEVNERDKELAIQAGLKAYQEQAPKLDGMVGSWEAIEAFSALIRADEREACAKVCEDKWASLGPARPSCVADIRARGNK